MANLRLHDRRWKSEDDYKLATRHTFPYFRIRKLNQKKKKNNNNNDEIEFVHSVSNTPCIRRGIIISTCAKNIRFKIVLFCRRRSRSTVWT